MKKPNIFTNWLFGAETLHDKKILAQILNDTDPAFLTWAMDQIVSWSHTSVSGNITHIHGSKDRLLPIVFNNPDIIIENGGHLMTINQAHKIMQILCNIIIAS
ncbi:hypothetical protein RCC89_14365 [Cytophagaceae bacterium ABcell3]|nr:hypothetical protein RCC89_14365 [Cytophagaceae bacterium ABcell3]